MQNQLVQTAQQQVQPVQPAQVQSQAQQPQAAPTDETANWQTYTDSFYNFTFKYPNGMVANLLKLNGSVANSVPSQYTIKINRPNDVTTNGVTIGDVSEAFLNISAAPVKVTGSTINIDSPSGQIAATYSTATTPMGYTYYEYDFQKNGNYYSFRMNNYDPVFLSAADFKKMVDTIKFAK